MKKWITLNLCLLLSGFLAGQSENKETQPVKGYEINGFITGKYTGKVYLVKEDGMHGPQTKVDSCEVKEGRFRFKGDTVPEYSVIYFIQSHDGQLAPVFLEAGQMNMTMRADYFLGSVTKGTINNNLWSLHQLQTRYWIDSMLLASNTHYMRYGRGSFAVEDSLFKYRTWEQNTKKLNMEKYMARFYNDQAFAPFIMLFEMTNELSLDELKEHYHHILTLLGEDPEREGLLKTPERVAKAMLALTKGYSMDPHEVLRSAKFKEDYNQMVIVKDIDFFSLCEHHMLPFYGKAHVAYIPNGYITGLSKIARVVDIFSHRLQVQERMTLQIKECIQETLNPLGVMVVVEAKHMCMQMRGVEKQNSITTTSDFTGAFNQAKTREEFMNLIRHTS